MMEKEEHWAFMLAAAVMVMAGLVIAFMKWHYRYQEHGG